MRRGPRVILCAPCSLPCVGLRLREAVLCRWSGCPVLMHSPLGEQIVATCSWQVWREHHSKICSHSKKTATSASDSMLNLTNNTQLRLNCNYADSLWLPCNSTVTRRVGLRICEARHGARLWFTATTCCRATLWHDVEVRGGSNSAADGAMPQSCLPSCPTNPANPGGVLSL